MNFVQLDLSSIPRDTSPVFAADVINALPSSDVRLCFLDVDGVLNSSAERLATSINEACLLNFCEFVHKNDMHIVVSSTWRKVSNGGRLLLVDCNVVGCSLPSPCDSRPPPPSLRVLPRR